MTGHEAWRHAVQTDLMPSNASQQQPSQSCAHSIQQAQQASQASEPIGYADSTNQAQPQQHDQGRFGTAIPHTQALQTLVLKSMQRMTCVSNIAYCAKAAFSCKKGEACTLF